MFKKDFKGDDSKLIKNGLSKVVCIQGKKRLESVNLSEHAKSVDAILMTPPWLCDSIGNKKAQPAKGKLTIEQFE